MLLCGSWLQGSFKLHHASRWNHLGHVAGCGYELKGDELKLLSWTLRRSFVLQLLCCQLSHHSVLGGYAQQG